MTDIFSRLAAPSSHVTSANDVNVTFSDGHLAGHCLSYGGVDIAVGPCLAVLSVKIGAQKRATIFFLIVQQLNSTRNYLETDILNYG